MRYRRLDGLVQRAAIHGQTGRRDQLAYLPVHQLQGGAQFGEHRLRVHLVRANQRLDAAGADLQIAELLGHGIVQLA